MELGKRSRSLAALEPTVTSLIKIYEKLAYCKYEKQCAITKLSLENLAPIFKLLDMENRQNIRLVCKNFKESVDHFVGIHVNLDQSKIDLRERWHPVGMPPPGASSLRIWNINSPKYLDHVLKRSHLVTQVQFAGQVSLSSITKILSRCVNLHKIAFTDRSHMYSSLLSVRLQHLHTLDIGCPGHSTDYLGEYSVASTLWTTYEMVLKKLTAPNLKIFRMYFCCVEDCTVLHRAIAQIFRFLAGHPLLEELSLTLHHRYERFPFLEHDVNYRKFRIDVPKKLLRSLQLKRVQVETMEPAFKIWDFILPSQKFLTHLDVLNRNRRWFYYSKLVQNNHSTLRDVRIHNISPRKAKTPHLNCNIFAVCTGLETLFLSRFENCTQEIVYCYPNEKEEFPFLDTETSSVPEIDNLKCLPVGLKNLHLQGLVVSTNDLIQAVRNLQQLEIVELQLLGYHYPGEGRLNEVEFDGSNLGVNSAVIQDILKHCRALNALFIEEFENAWTQVRQTGLWDSLSELSLVPDEGYSKDGGYYGILICSEIPRNNGRLTRSERMHLWDIRLSQYYQHSISKRHTIRKSSSTNFDFQTGQGYDTDHDGGGDLKYRVEPIVSETSLLEILDKENGQLEKIHKILTECETPRPITPNQLRAEETRRFAKKYHATVYSAIPNYHKASRLLENMNQL